MHVQSDIKIGDTVYLNSGSPPLKVIIIDGYYVCCGWVWGEIPMNQWFNIDCLTKEAHS